MYLTLPPKRWEPATDARYDSIRYKPWFGRLCLRKHHIPRLEQAFRANLDGSTQKAAASDFMVDPRELRDYERFRTGSTSELPRFAQDAIDMAYRDYCRDNASRPFHFYLRIWSKWLALNPRAIRELWEVDPGFYPTNYDRKTRP